LIAIFAVSQVLAMVGSAIYRLTPLALEPILDGSLTPPLTVAMVMWVIFNAYAEGYRGFQKRFSPRTVARAAYLGENPRPLDVLFALPFSMGLYFANRRQLIVSWVFLLGLAALITFVRALPQPYRGIIDAGVVIGLGWGALSLVYSLYRYLVTGDVEMDGAAGARRGALVLPSVLGDRPRRTGFDPSPHFFNRARKSAVAGHGIAANRAFSSRNQRVGHLMEEVRGIGIARDDEVGGERFTCGLGLAVRGIAGSAGEEFAISELEGVHP